MFINKKLSFLILSKLILLLLLSTKISAGFYVMNFFNDNQEKDIKIDINDNDFIVAHIYFKNNNDEIIFLPCPFLLTQTNSEEFTIHTNFGAILLLNSNKINCNLQDTIAESFPSENRRKMRTNQDINTQYVIETINLQRQNSTLQTLEDHPLDEEIERIVLLPPFISENQPADRIYVMPTIDIPLADGARDPFVLAVITINAEKGFESRMHTILLNPGETLYGIFPEATVSFYAFCYNAEENPPTITVIPPPSFMSNNTSDVEIIEGIGHSVDYSLKQALHAIIALRPNLAEFAKQALQNSNMIYSDNRNSGPAQNRTLRVRQELTVTTIYAQFTHAELTELVTSHPLQDTSAITIAADFLPPQDTSAITAVTTADFLPQDTSTTTTGSSTHAPNTLMTFCVYKLKTSRFGKWLGSHKDTPPTTEEKPEKPEPPSTQTPLPLTQSPKHKRSEKAERFFKKEQE